MATSRKARRLEVRIDGRFRPEARCLAIFQSAGATPTDSAVLEFERIGSRDLRRFQDVELGDLFQDRQVEVIVRTRAGRRKVLHWGRIASFDYSLDGRGDRARVVSRTEPHHFGGPHAVTHQAIIHPSTRRLLGVHEEHQPAVFNPQIDGRAFPNQYAGRTPGFLPVFLDPDAHPRGRIDRARFWSLASAAAYLCYSLNFEQRYIKNPTLRELAFVLGFDPTILRDHEVRLGSYLPEALDALIRPYGFSWHVQYLRPGLRKLRFFKLRGGRPVFLRHQRARTAIDNRRSNAPQISISYDKTSQTVNDVFLYGGLYELESTFDLFPAWDPKYDDRQREKDLVAGADAWTTTPDLQRVWRDWVLNESNEYTALRKSIKNVNLNTLFGPKPPLPPPRGPKPPPPRGFTYPRRRRFGPTLTLGEDGAPIGENHGVTVEYWDNLQQQWLPVTDVDGGNFELLENEAGIRFTDKLVPKEIYNQRDSAGKLAARVRITATLTADVRVFAFNRALRSSHLRDRKREVLNLEDRFKLRLIHPDSIYFKKVRAGDLRSAESDDRPGATRLASGLRLQWDQATVSGQAVIEGIDWPGEALGHAIAGIDGKQIGFRSTARRRRDRRYPTATAVEYLVQEQKTRVFLETFRGNA